MTVFWSTLALERVSEASDYIAQRDAETAERWVENLFAAAERLEQFPESGRVVPEVGRPDIREIIHDRYRIIYKIKPERVEVLTVRHTRQLLDPDDLTDRD